MTTTQRLHFYITDGRDSLSDDYGAMCQTTDEVEAEALKTWNDTLASATEGTDWEDWYVSVQDASGNIVGMYIFN